MAKVFAVVLCVLSAMPAFADLTADQKQLDFQSMAALYSKRYAPYEWKKWALGFDALDIAPWIDRVRKSANDIEYYEICAEYVASLKDTHSNFSTPFNFLANLGFAVDIYDGKVIVESINRTLLPAAQFPFQVGDELLAVDGRTAEEWISYLSRFRQWGNPGTTRRYVADGITYRPASLYPSAVNLPDTSVVLIRRMSGAEETYTVPWIKTGNPATSLGPVPTPRAAAPRSTEPDYLDMLAFLRNWRMPAEDPLLQGETTDPDTGETVARRYLLGLGSRTPVFAMPATFRQRLGATAANFHFSGVYESQGFRIGYLRVPSFTTSATSLLELAQEIAYFQQNTDGLVVDVMRNPGGDCYMLTLASYLIPTSGFYFFGEQLRPYLALINSLKNSLDTARARGSDQWIIDLYSSYLNQLQQAYAENRGMTGPIPACSLTFENEPARDASGNLAAYTKPLIILTDEFSISAADIFPAMMQDNRRGAIVGMRTSGGGGSVSSWPLFFSEATVRNTNSLVVRKEPIATPDLPAAPYVENIGVRPDVQLDYMTRENLLTRGQPFVDAFTRILIDRIRAGQP